MGDKIKNPILQKYIDEGRKIYSFSKLSTMNTCEYEYWNTYIDKKKGKDNVYSIIGGSLHDSIENIYNGSSDKSTMVNKFHDQLIELELLNIKFPNQKIKDSYVADVGHFVKNFKPIDSKFVLEKHIVFPLNDDIVLQGYLDAIQPSEKGKPFVNIIDWKTSSKFSGKKLNEAGRQLLMYKLALESTTSLKVDKIMWFMIKYLYVSWRLKNGKIKKKMCNRGKWVKEMRNTLEKDLIKLNIDQFELDILLDNAIKNNNIDDLPEEVKSKYILEDCFVEYEATEEKIEELKEYVISTVNNIESKGIDSIEWQPVEITKYDSFYCATLCGHRQVCPFYKKFLDKNSEGFDKKKDSGMVDLDELFT
ncbi:PD-(D/E)XK nuclease family protein [Lederbergia lenta]|uniref:PD-(D/E)XK nuclease family protein n=1 Tax=Lederbergia lenta TaxID=1467 RepID=UPI002041C893|nr:PD-(D/E)XK nuclease family protein [Lederbergia lenta]MCM3109902.1 PD-(D/E)XK nuclease family protein [Lederbergia lenta]